MIKTTRLKPTQVPKNITFDLTDQVDGERQTFTLPQKCYDIDTHYVLFNGQVYRNDDNATYYSISDDGMTLTTYFDTPPLPGVSHVLQFVKTDDTEAEGNVATESYVDNAVSVLQGEIDTIVAASDVKDIVGTHADLEAYDTSTLGDNDIIKVLVDETEDNKTSYYRWSTSTETFTLIGTLGPFQGALTAGANITIDANNEISAIDTTYDAFVGTDGVDAGVIGLVPAPAAADSSKFLKADGTWAVTPDTTYTNFTGTDGNTDGTAGLVPAPVTTDAGKFLKADGTWDTVSGGIDLNTTFWGQSVANGVVDGNITGKTSPSSFSVEYKPDNGNRGASMIMSSAGGFSFMSIMKNGSIWSGSTVFTLSETSARFRPILSQYYNTPTMPTNDNEYACKAYVDRVGNTLSATAPTTATAGVLGQLYTDTTAMHTYQLTAIDTTDPDNPSYTWTQRW